MGQVGKGKTLVSASIPDALVSLIDKRAKALRWSRARYALAIIEQWKANGCPPVSDADHALEVLAGKPTKKSA